MNKKAYTFVNIYEDVCRFVDGISLVKITNLKSTIR